MRFITPKPCVTCDMRSSCEAELAPGRGLEWVKPSTVGLPPHVGSTYLGTAVLPALDTRGRQVFFEHAGEVLLQCRGCGRWRRARAVHGIRNPKLKCGARCRNATGFDCECSCGGKNHGGGYEN